MEKRQKAEKQMKNGLPIAKNEDVDYQNEFADDNDRIALERAAEADERQQS